MRTLICGLILVSIATGVSAQFFTDAFNYGTGPTIGTWTEAKGNWSAVANQAEAEQVFAWQYATQPLMMYKDCACQCDVIYNKASSQALQFGGVAIRANGAANDTNTVMCKFQDNNSNGQFDRLYIYDRPGGSTWADPTTPTTKGTVRLLAIDKRLVCQLDTDGDGLWDLVVNRTSTQTPVAGPIAIDGFGGAFIDNFALFEAVLLPDTANTSPIPGSAQKYVMRGNANEAFQAALSFGNTGIPVGPAGTIPLSFDPLLVASLNFPGFSGTLDANGDGDFTVNIPNAGILVGLTYYTGFVTINAGISGISNDHQETIV